MFIYLVENLRNGKRYVGQTTFDVTVRWQGHIEAAAGKSSSAYLHRAIRKYGAENFVVREIAIASSVEELDFLEIRFINWLGTMAPNGYNQAEGGRNNRKGVKASEETKALQRAAWVKRRARGEGRPNLGKHWSAEQRQRMASGKKKAWEKEGERERISALQREGWANEESKAKARAHLTQQRTEDPIRFTNKASKSNKEAKR